MPTWLAYFVGAVIAALIAILLAPYIPSPGDHIVAVIAWIVCVILTVLGLFWLVRRPRV